VAHTLGLTLEEYDKAIINFQKAIDIDRENVEAYDYLGTVYYLLKQKQLARENLLKAKKLYEKQGNQHKIQEIENILKDTEDISSLVPIKKARSQPDSLAIEESIVAKKTKQELHEVSVYLEEIRGLISQGNIHKAIEQLQTAIQLNPNNPDIYALMGKAYASLGSNQYDVAGEYFQTALKIDPNCIEANIGLGIVTSHFGLYERSLAHFQKALKDTNLSDEQYAAIYLGLGGTYLSLGEYGKAEDYLQRSLEKGVISPLAYLHLATVDIWMQRFHKAKNNLEKAKELFKKTGNQRYVQKCDDYLQALQKKLRFSFLKSKIFWGGAVLFCIVTGFFMYTIRNKKKLKVIKLC